jgi:succinate dehydrogenase/fumarate reductase-like Fe-S protein
MHYLAAKKAKFSPNYGCEEGKCGSCELKVNGKTKIRPCIGKVPAAGPCVLTEP